MTKKKTEYVDSSSVYGSIRGQWMMEWEPQEGDTVEPRPTVAHVLSNIDGGPDAHIITVPLTIVDMVPIARFPPGSPVPVGGDFCADKRGYEYDDRQMTNGGDTWHEVIEYGPDGAATGRAWIVNPKPEPPSGTHKADGVCCKIVRRVDGVNAVRVKGPSHWTSEAAGRDYYWCAADIIVPGLQFDPNNPEHGDNQPLLPGVVPEEGGVSAEDVTRIIRAELATFKGLLIGEFRPQIRSNVESLFKNGIDGGSNIVWAQLVNTSFSGCREAMRVMGISEEAVFTEETRAMLDAAEVVLMYPDDYARIDEPDFSSYHEER